MAGNHRTARLNICRRHLQNPQCSSVLLEGIRRVAIPIGLSNEGKEYKQESTNGYHSYHLSSSSSLPCLYLRHLHTLLRTLLLLVRDILGPFYLKRRTVCITVCITLPWTPQCNQRAYSHPRSPAPVQLCKGGRMNKADGRVQPTN
jgi:hypothetical protein